MQIHEIMILSIFDASMIIILLNSIMKHLERNIRYIVFFILVGSLLVAINCSLVYNDLLSHILSTLITYTCFMLYLRKNNECEVVSNTIVYFLISIILLVIQLLCIVLMNMIYGKFEYSFIYGLIGQAIGLLQVYLISKYFPLSQLYTFIKKKNLVFSIIISNIFILYYSISIIWYIDTLYIFKLAIGIISTIILVMIFNILLLREGILSKSYQEKVLIYESYLPIIDNIMEEFRKKQHDYHNHIQTLYTLNENIDSNNSDINDYIDGMKKDDIWNELLKIDNKIIIAFLYSKYITAKEKNIKLQYGIDNFSLITKHTNYELVEMYGILIDNAIEATENQDSEKVISVKLSKEDNKNIFQIINTYDYISTNS